jgi:hypothetical protein
LGEFWEGDAWRIGAENNLSCFERNRLYLNVDGRSFLDVSFISGADSDGDGRSVAAADLDNDGRQDLIVRQVGGGPLFVYQNQLPQRSWLAVSLRGRKSNSLGIGARMVAHVSDPQAGKRQIVRELYPINTYRSQDPSQAHFGLGDAEQVDRLTILWPSGVKQELKDITANRHIQVTEESDEIATIEPGKVVPP